MSKKRKDFSKFKADLESVVLRGNNNTDLQYVMEMVDSSELYATYLISRYGNRATALTARNFYITKNEEVTTLWSAYSREGMTRMDANECLMKYHGQL